MNDCSKTEIKKKKLLLKESYETVRRYAKLSLKMKDDTKIEKYGHIITLEDLKKHLEIAERRLEEIKNWFKENNLPIPEKPKDFPLIKEFEIERFSSEEEAREWANKRGWSFEGRISKWVITYDPIEDKRLQEERKLREKEKEIKGK